MEERYIDQTGEVIIQPQFERAYLFRKGIAGVKIDGRERIIDKSGKIIF